MSFTIKFSMKEKGIAAHEEPFKETLILLIKFKTKTLDNTTAKDFLILCYFEKTRPPRVFSVSGCFDVVKLKLNLETVVCRMGHQLI